MGNNSTQKQNALKLGRITGWLSGIGYLLVAIAFLNRPEVQQEGEGSIEYYNSLATDHFMATIESISFFLSALFVLGVITTFFFLLLDDERFVIMVYANLLGLIGFITTIIHFSTNIGRIMSFSSYTQLSEDTKDIVLVYGTSNIDPIQLVMFGLVSLWLILLSWVLLKGNEFSNKFSLTGLIFGIVYFLLTMSRIFHLGALNLLTALLGGVILAPLWFIWFGFICHKQLKSIE